MHDWPAMPSAGQAAPAVAGSCHYFGRDGDFEASLPGMSALVEPAGLDETRDCIPAEATSDTVDREALRILLVARDYATTTRTAAVNLFKSLLLTAPDQLRERLRRLSTPRQTAACALLRVNPREPIADQVRRQTLRSLAQRIRLLDKEIRTNARQLHDLVDAAMPALLGEPGVGPVSAAHLLIAWSHPGRCRSEAAFASLAGVSPLEASSGRVKRHRINPFGDRALYRAQHTIVNWRMIHGHEPTQRYLTRRRGQQKSDNEIRRLKRYTARHLFRLLETTGTPGAAG